MTKKDFTRDEVLISIKPEYTKRILKGTKTWEYRRRIWKGPVEKAFVYCTSPVCRVVGFFFVNGIYKNYPSIIWEQTHTRGGISKEEFLKYFHGVKYGYAIEIGHVTLYRSPTTLQNWDPDIKRAPQSFMYV